MSMKALKINYVTKGNDQVQCLPLISFCVGRNKTKADKIYTVIYSILYIMYIMLTYLVILHIVLVLPH